MARKAVILVDDGLAMGSTMRAAIMLCRKRETGSSCCSPVAEGGLPDVMALIADES
jgi:putative phosphoribosyl transferase